MERVCTGLRLPGDLNDGLTQEAKRQGFSKNALILQILQGWMKQNKQEMSPQKSI